MKENSGTVTVKENFPVQPETLWNAWTNQQLISQWFGSDPAGTVLSASLDVRPGGKFSISFRDDDQTQHTCSGIYREVAPGQRLSFTFTWQNEPGTEALIELTFFAHSGYTSLLLEHHNPGSAALHNYELGWKNTLAKLYTLLAA
ncbi:MAG: SRPBCC domain-containing protein [Ferruginibacter sp.]|nr:SRPBCC domain-containing protein [Ferruginibacter sp.]